MSRIPDEIVERILRETEMVALVEEYVQLSKKSAANYFGLCPFHQEDTPSFSVSPAKQIFYCFGCHKGGNAIRFIELIENLSFPEALRKLATRARIEIPEDDPQSRVREEARKAEKNCLLEAARYYYRLFESPTGQSARRYMTEKRRLTPAVLKKFGIGYAGAEWDGLCRHLRTKGFSDKEILSSGLVRTNRQGGLYDLFRDRVIFPIFDSFGQLIAFGGRVMDGSEPKYINSPETNLYRKGSQIYALNFARKVRSESLILTEGYLDTIALHDAGVTTAVAGLGTALTGKQAQLLRKFTEKLIVAYDADEAGQRAASRSLEILGKSGFELKILVMPENMDPDDYIHRYGAERFQALLERALPLLDYKLYLARKRASVGKGELDYQEYATEAAKILAEEENVISRELYAAKIADEIGISVATVLREIDRRKDGRSEAAAETTALRSGRRHSRDTILSRYELALLAALLEIGEERQAWTESIRSEDFSESVSAFASAVLTHFREGKLNAPLLLQLAQQSRAELKLDEQIAAHLGSIPEDGRKSPEILGEGALRAMRRERLEEQKTLLLECLELSADSGERAELLAEIQSCNIKITEFL